jgi:hypothetical protein
MPNFLLVWATVYIAVSVPLTFAKRKMRGTNRRQWLGIVGRTPRDLFADRRVRLFTNLTEEWVWIGFVVVVAGYVWLFVNPNFNADLMTGIGFAMMVVRAIGKPLCVAYAELSPQYENATEAVFAP